MQPRFIEKGNYADEELLVEDFSFFDNALFTTEDEVLNAVIEKLKEIFKK